MNEFDVTQFEAAFERRVRRYAAVPTRRFDAAAIAHDAVRPRRRLALPSLTRPALAPAYVLLLITLAGALLVGAAFAAGLLRPPQQPRPLGANGAIAFQVDPFDRSMAGDVHEVSADGSGDRLIATGRAPSFSADGVTLSYEAFDNTDPSLAEPHLVVAAADGGNPRTVSRAQVYEFKVAPDAHWAVGRETADGALTLLDLTSGAARTLLGAPSDPAVAYDDEVAWSPDSRFVAVGVLAEVHDGANIAQYQAAIDVVDVSTGVVHTVTERPGNPAGLGWSPDGSSLVYLGLPDGQPATEFAVAPPDLDIFTIRADGTDEHNVTNAPSSYSSPLWSPDGSRIAFRSSVAEDYLLGVIGATGGGVVYGPSVGLVSGDFIWSPDATMLLLVRNAHTYDVAAGDVYTGTLDTVDSSFRTAPKTLATFDRPLAFPSWQRLER